MKRLSILSFVLLLVLTCCYAQTTFKLPAYSSKEALFKCEKGVFTSRDNSSEFVVIPLDGLSQKDIFHKMILTLNDVYEDFEKVVSKIENEAITVNGYKEYKEEKKDFTTGGGNGSSKKFHQMIGFNYRLSFKIKDGKLRIDAPIVSNVDYYEDVVNTSQKRNHNSLAYLDALDNEQEPMRGFLCQRVKWDIDSILQNIFKKLSLQLSGKNDDW